MVFVDAGIVGRFISDVGRDASSANGCAVAVSECQSVSLFLKSSGEKRPGDWVERCAFRSV